MLNRFVSKFGTLLLLTVVLALSVSAESKYNYFGTQFTDWNVFIFPTAGGQVTWSILRNDNPSPPTGQTFMNVPWGQSASEFVPNQGDWDGNGVADFAIYRDGTATPSNTYLIQLLQAGGVAGGQQYGTWGINVGLTNGDSVGSEGDYDGDGKMDYTITRPSGSAIQWFVLKSSDSTVLSFPWGLTATDQVLPGGDYNGDGKDDPAVARINATNGIITWFAGEPFAATPIISMTWGDFDTDFIVAGGDYDGDNKADFMVWRGFGAVDGVWYLRTNSGNTSYLKFGTASATTALRDLPLRSGDYDGDGRTDIAVYRPSTKTFFVNRSEGSGVQSQIWGGPTGTTTIPIQNFGVF